MARHDVKLLLIRKAKVSYFVNKMGKLILPMIFRSETLNTDLLIMFEIFLTQKPPSTLPLTQNYKLAVELCFTRNML